MLAHWMKTLSFLFALAAFADCEVSADKVLSRRKRYLTFPEGAVVSFAVCITSATYIYPPKIFSQNLAWGVEYELPPNDTIIEFFRPTLLKKRRNRRELYERIESLVTTLGFNGKDCILRSLCEASQKFRSDEGSLLHLISKIIFGYPVEDLLPFEPEQHRVYQSAAQKGLGNQQCDQLYDCPFSLIDVALGHYSRSLT